MRVLYFFFLSKCKCDYKGVWLFFFLSRQQNFSIQMNVLPMKVAVLEAACFSCGAGVAENLLRPLGKPPRAPQHRFSLFQCLRLSVDVLFSSSPAFGRIFSNVAHKLPMKACPQRGAPNDVPVVVRCWNQGCNYLEGEMFT